MMTVMNQSATEFILLGFPSSRQLQLLLFLVFIDFYVLTIAANMFIIYITKIDCTLRKIPMYTFLCHFSFLEIWYITSTVPKMLVDFMVDNNIISYHGCIAQMYFFLALGLTELFFLAVMAYDRYLAICYPLHYSSLMTSKLSSQMVLLSWLGGFLSSILLVVPGSRLLFCGPRIIDHFFCDFIPLLNISCNETLVTDMIFYAFAWIIIIYSLLLTTVSYIQIIKTICCLPSQISRRRAFSTCVSHLTVVLTFYGTVVFMYIRPTTQYALNWDKVVSVFYVVVTPLLNPLVYSLRNREVHEALRKNLAHLGILH